MKERANNIRRFALITFLLVIAGLFAYYRFMSREPEVDTISVPKTELDRLMVKDLDDSYPQTAKEVMELYCRYMQFVYNNEVSDEEFKTLVEQMRKMYHPEFLAVNKLDDQIKKIDSEISKFMKAKSKISTYSVDPKVERMKYEGKQCALLKITLLISGSEGYSKTYESFILAKDGENWKIIGFRQDLQNDKAKQEGTNKG